MKNILWYLFCSFVAISLLACDKENNGKDKPDGPDVVKEQYLHSIRVEIEGQRRTIQLKYTEDWVISEIEIPLYVSFKFHYNELKQLTKVEEFLMDWNTATYVTDSYLYSYSGSNVTETKYSHLGNSYNDTITYELNIEGLPVNAYYNLLSYHYDGDVLSKIEKTGEAHRVYIYNTHQQVEQAKTTYTDFTTSSQTALTFTYEYDNKVHPLNNVGYKNLWIYTRELMNSDTDFSILGFGLLENNCTKDLKIQTDKHGVESLVNSRTYSYEYNSNDLPTKMTAAVDVEQTGADIYSCTFIYHNKEQDDNHIVAAKSSGGNL